MKNPRLLALGIAVLAVLGGVAAYLFLYEGAVAVYVKDASGPWDHVWVTFSAVDIHESGKDNASWVTVVSTKQTVDLAALTSVSQLLGSARLSPGHYEQIRLAVVNVTGVLVGTTQILDITVPPDNATLKIPGQFTVASGQTTKITVDIQLDASIHPVGSEWVFEPVAHATVG